MNQRLLTGVFILAITLALVGAATTAHDIEAEEQANIGSEVVAVKSVSAARAQVPLRSAFLEAQGEDEVDASTIPAVVRIPDLSLEASILSVGVDEQNRFAVPAADTVGWYQYSSVPGSPGATVLAAHVDYAGRPGAFFNLGALEVGEVLEVEMADGSVMAYRVTDTAEYEKIDLPTKEIFRKDGESVLQLITCGGSFDQDLRSYRANVVVTAVPITA